MGRGSGNQQLVSEASGDAFAAVLGVRRGPNGSAAVTWRFVFAGPLNAGQQAEVDGYLRTKLDRARPRVTWRFPHLLHVDFVAEPTRDQGIVRLHLQQLAGISLPVADQGEKDACEA